MTQQIINLGTADKGNGDVLRTAFGKVNANFAELYNQIATSVVVGATAPTGPEEGALWWNSESGRMYVYYGTAWVDASPVDGAGISSTNELVNGAYTVSLESDGVLTLPNGTNIYGDGIFKADAVGGFEFNSFTDNIGGGKKTWTFSTDGNLTFPQGTLLGYSDPGGFIIDGAVDKDIAIYTYSGADAHGWTFGTDGSLTFPDSTVQTTAWTGITGFGEGFSLTAADKIVTNKLYSTNLTQPTQHYRLELDTNGVIILPDQSIINGSTLRGVYGTGDANYTGITIGPDAAHREESWMYVDHTGSYIATQYNTNQKLWQFKNDGSTTLPSGAGFVKGDNGQLKTNDGTTLSLDFRDTSGRGFYTNGDGFSLRGNGSNTWTFGADGKLTLPGAIVKSTVAKTGVVLPTTTGAVTNIAISPQYPGNLTNSLPGEFYGPFTLGTVVNFAVVVQGGNPVVFYLATQPILTVGDVIGTIDSGDLGGTPGTTFTFSVSSVAQETPTALDLTKSINKLTEGEYTLANGVEGQIMYMVPQASVNTASDVRVTVANFRASTFTGTNGTMFPFRWYDGTGYIDNTGMCTLIFTDGAWQQQGGSWS